MRIDDLIILGRTEPQQTKTSGITICTAGYSHELKQFMRIYPLLWGGENLPRWTTVSAELKRNPKDSRRESWRVNCEKEANSYDHITTIGKAIKDREFDYLSGLSTTIDQLNSSRASLGILKPSSDVLVQFGINKGVENLNQFSLFEPEPSDCPIAKNYVHPRLVFENNGKYHNMRLDDWGCYEFIRKNSENIEALSGALNFNNDYEHLFFVGNLNAIRNVWIVISVISRKRNKNTDIFSFT